MARGLKQLWVARETKEMNKESYFASIALMEVGKELIAEVWTDVYFDEIMKSPTTKNHFEDDEQIPWHG